MIYTTSHIQTFIVDCCVKKYLADSCETRWQSIFICSFILKKIHF